MYNLDDSITDFARASLNYGLQRLSQTRRFDVCRHAQLHNLVPMSRILGLGLEVTLLYGRQRNAPRQRRVFAGRRYDLFGDQR